MPVSGIWFNNQLAVSAGKGLVAMGVNDIIVSDADRLTARKHIDKGQAGLCLSEH